MSESSKPRLPRATEMAHRLLAERLRPGDLAIDATVGNGHDTVLLAEAVGQAGQVIGFDIQPIAIEATRHRLSEAGLSDRVELHTECHSRMEAILVGPGVSARTITLNLGYLPGGDKAKVTRTETTLFALEASLRLLAPGGLLTIVAYPGHPEGKEECRAVEAWSAELSQTRYSVAVYRFLNQVNDPPILLAIERR